MAVAGAKITVEFPELEKLRAGIRNLGDKEAAAELLGEALYKAVYPAFLRLGEVTPIGPTRNLRRAVDLKVKTYKRTGGAVALFGYRRAGAGPASSAQGGSVRGGKDRAFHQWWLEFGTKARFVTKISNKPYQRRSPTTPFTRVRNNREEVVRGKGVVHWVSGQNAVIASSFNRLGPFKFVKNREGRVQTDPPYDKAFFRKAKKGQTIRIEPIQPGGVDGMPPIQTAWSQTKGVVAERLQRELRLSLENAVKALVYRDTGSITGAITQAGG